jgi:NADH-quinone oxidoreductase subunit J
MSIAANVALVVIAIVMLVAAVRVVTTSNIVHAAVALMFVLAGTAAIFLLLGAEFLGWTQVFLYVGAIVVLFLFGTMLTRARLGSSDDLDAPISQRWIAVAVTGLLLVVFAVVIGRSFGSDQIRIEGTTPRFVVDGKVVTGVEFRGGKAYLEGEEVVVTGPAPRQKGVLDRPTTASELADDLFENWVLPFEAVSIVLLAALIGSIVLARPDDPEHVADRGVPSS